MVVAKKICKKRVLKLNLYQNNSQASCFATKLKRAILPIEGNILKGNTVPSYNILFHDNMIILFPYFDEIQSVAARYSCHDCRMC